MLPRKATWTAAFSGVLLLAALGAHAVADEKEPAPHFNARTMDGEKFNNDAIKGKVVLLEFWTTWCSYCLDEAPYVDRINRDYADKGVVVLAVNVGESKKTVKKYLEIHPRSSRIVLTDDTNLAAMYEATVYPIYVVVGRDGNIAGTQRGAAGERTLREFLANADTSLQSEMNVR